jgi:hypothetical protein
MSNWLFRQSNQTTRTPPEPSGRSVAGYWLLVVETGMPPAVHCVWPAALIFCVWSFAWPPPRKSRQTMTAPPEPSPTISVSIWS